MSHPKICPQCGAAQQWEMWRRCPCGYDFGQASPETPAAAAGDRRPQAAEDDFDDERLNRFLWLLYVVAGILLTIAEPFPALHWLGTAAAYVLVLLLFAPLRFPPKKR